MEFKGGQKLTYHVRLLLYLFLLDSSLLTRYATLPPQPASAPTARSSCLEVRVRKRQRRQAGRWLGLYRSWWPGTRDKSVTRLRRKSVLNSWKSSTLRSSTFRPRLSYPGTSGCWSVTMLLYSSSWFLHFLLIEPCPKEQKMSLRARAVPVHHLSGNVDLRSVQTILL